MFFLYRTNLAFKVQCTAHYSKGTCISRGISKDTNTITVLCKCINTYLRHFLHSVLSITQNCSAS